MTHQLPTLRLTALGAVLLTGCSGCGESARLVARQDTGANPVLVEPDTSLIPTVKVATATGWPAGVTPTAAAGLKVNAFATGLEHPRWVYVLPNGDVLVAETNRPETPDPAPDPLRGAALKAAMKKAGAAVPSPTGLRRPLA